MAARRRPRFDAAAAIAAIAAAGVQMVAHPIPRALEERVAIHAEQLAGLEQLGLAGGKVGDARLGVTYTPVHVIGPTQDAVRGHYKTLNGVLPGFSQGQQAAGSMKTVMDGLEALIGTQIESVGVGLPNNMSAPSLSYLNGETRFVVFAAPLIPHGDSTASIQKLLSGTYDAKIQATAKALIDAGLNGARVCLRVGWEFNSGSGNGLQSGFEWATAHLDPQTGVANGISNYKLGAAHYETVLRSTLGSDGVTTFTGWVEWNGGNGDTSALPIEQAMPTHGSNTNTLWGWDIYWSNPYNGAKNDPATGFAATKVQYLKYVTYCRANGYLMGHGEYGMTYKASSPYSYNDNDVWVPLFYQLLVDNSDVAAYANFYNQNQHVTNPAPNGWPDYTDLTILDESHSLFGCGGFTGTPSSTVATGPYSYGASGLNSTGSQHTIATMGSLQQASTTSATWTYTTDANKTKTLASWRLYFGGDGGLGAAGLQKAPPAPPVGTAPPHRLNTIRNAQLVYG